MTDINSQAIWCLNHINVSGRLVAKQVIVKTVEKRSKQRQQQQQQQQPTTANTRTPSGTLTLSPVLVK